MLAVENRVHDAIARLRSLREGDLAVLDLTACGTAAMGPLREFLFAREPSGMFLPRCQAVEALAALGAKEVLYDFLAHPRDVDDPVEQTGEDAVANAAARALIRWPEEAVFSLLLVAAHRKLLAGVVEALGSYRCGMAMPVFAAALAEDFCRPEAEEAFRKIGAPACPCLLQLADYRTPSSDTESESSRRRRRSALRLLAELHRGNDVPEILWSRVTDADPQVAVLACSICLPRLRSAERQTVVTRLVELLDGHDWVLHVAVEDLLIQHYAMCRPVIELSLVDAREPAAASLRRVIAKGEISCEGGL
ncbi:MAG TPA: hypothetical protein VK558_02665 [Patescibacteria group bacterium]|nr:hypothetical protein [Patescibacteria group bacterium]